MARTFPMTDPLGPNYVLSDGRTLQERLDEDTRVRQARCSDRGNRRGGWSRYIILMTTVIISGPVAGTLVAIFATQLSLSTRLAAPITIVVVAVTAGIGLSVYYLSWRGWKQMLLFGAVFGAVLAGALGFHLLVTT